MVFIPSNLEKPKQVNSAVYTDALVAVDGNYDDVNRLASGDRGRGGGLGLRQRQRAPLLRRGLQDARATRSPSNWAGGIPDQVVIPVASGSQLTKVDKAFR